MAIVVSNTNLNDSFNTWRNNTNEVATIVSNNVVTVSRAGSANRSGVSYGNGHIKGTFTANELRATTIKGGNTSTDSSITIASNTTISPTTLTVSANTTISGNVIINTSGAEVFDMGNISRMRMTGGSAGQFLRKSGTSGLDFEPLTLRQISDLSSNSAHIILSGSNTTFSDNGDSPHLKFADVNGDTVELFVASDGTAGDSDLHIILADANGDSAVNITDSSNTVVASVDSDGNADFSGTLTADGTTTLNGSVVLGDADSDTITVKGKFANQATTGVASFNGTTHFNGTTNMNGTLNLNGTVNVGDAATDTITINSTASLAGNTTIGDSTADTLTVNSRVVSHLVANGAYDLGTSSLEWRNLYLDGTAKVDTLTVDENATVTGNLTVNGDTTLGDATGDTITIKGNFANQHTEGLATFGGNVGVGTASITTGVDLDVANSAKVGENLTVSGNTSITGNLTVTGSFTVPADAAFEAADATFINLHVSGNSTIGDSGSDIHTITGATTIAGAMTLTGNIDHAGNLDTSGSISNDGTVVIGANGKLHANNTITNGTIRDVHLENSGVTAASYGSATAIPVITVDAKGLITSATTTTVAGVTGITYTSSNNNIRISTADGSTFDDVIDPATTSVKGVASFDSGDFDVSSGAVSLKNATTGAVLAVSGTSNEVNVSRSNGTVTVGLPDDVTVTGQLNVGENVVVTGNLTVSGTTTTVNTETVNIADNILVLNSNESGTPSQNGGFEIERGTSTNKTLLWNETSDKWTVGSETFVAGTFEGNVTGDVTGNADTATALETARSIGISLSGDITGSASASFDGTGDITITATNMAVQNNSVDLGTHTTGNYVNNLTAGALIDISGSAGEGWSPTVAVDLSELTDMTDAAVSTDELVILDAGSQKRKAISEITLGLFNTTNQIALGTDTTGNYMADVGVGTGLDVSHTPGEGSTATISLDLSELTTSTTNGDGDYFVVVDASNVSRKLTKANIAISEFNTTNGIALGTDTTGNYMTNVSAGAGIDVSHTQGEGSTATISIESDLRGDVDQIGLDTNDYYNIDATMHRWYLDGAEDMRLTNNGNLDVEGNVVAHSTTVSDRNLKHDIERIDNALEKICQLGGYTFTYNKDDRKGAGLIAQEVEEVLPSAVTETEILNVEGVHKVLEYDQVHGLIIEAIKELKAEIDELKGNK